MVHSRRIVLAFALLLLMPVCAFSQTDGSAPRDLGSAATSSPSSGADPVAPAPTSTGSTSAPAPTATTSGAAPRPAPTPTIRAEPASSPTTPDASPPLPLATAITDGATEERGSFLELLLSEVVLYPVLLLLSAAVIAIFLRSDKKEKGDESKCDDIREMIEQKKRELEETIRAWPEEKLKSLATDAALAEASSDPAAKALIETAQRAHKKITTLKDAIELLQTRFDLCMLSVHMPGTGEYEGTLIENSLVDAAVLEHVQVTKAYAQGAWSVKDVAVSEKQIEKLSEHLSEGPWHMRFKKKGTDTGFIVFRHRRFPITYADRSTWQEAITHGRALGISEDLLDFNREL